MKLSIYAKGKREEIILGKDAVESLVQAGFGTVYKIGAHNITIPEEVHVETDGESVTVYESNRSAKLVDNTLIEMIQDTYSTLKEEDYVIFTIEAVKENA
jgi:hypothetical protein